MGVPVRHNVTITGIGESDWLPLNRWGSAKTRIFVEVTGTATYSLVGTHRNVLRTGPATTAQEIEIPDHTDEALTDDENLTVQDLIFEAVKLKVTAGTGAVNLRLQTEGDD